MTNKHVIAGAIDGIFSFSRKVGDDPVMGEPIQIKLTSFESKWIPHPNPDIDLAAFVLTPIENQLRDQGSKIFFKAVDKTITAKENELEELSGIENVVFVGFPNGIWDSRNGLPVIRRGTTASPVEVDFEGRPEFIIDASVFGGSSGSPVFSYKSVAYLSKGSLMTGPNIRFIGVVTAVFFRTSINGVRQLPVPTVNGQVVDSQEMLDLGVITKARCVTELCDHVAMMHGVSQVV